MNNHYAVSCRFLFAYTKNLIKKIYIPYLQKMVEEVGFKFCLTSGLTASKDGYYISLTPHIHFDKLKVVTVQESENKYSIGLDLRDAFYIKSSIMPGGLGMSYTEKCFLEFCVAQDVVKGLEFGLDLSDDILSEDSIIPTWYFPLVTFEFPNAVRVNATNNYMYWVNVDTKAGTYLNMPLYGSIERYKSDEKFYAMLSDSITNISEGGSLFVSWSVLNFRIKNSAYIEERWNVVKL